ncbi:Uncharacterised protein [Vibrio cholerae]|nr:Uncharacterised protein [Vibrio cholerae]
MNLNRGNVLANLIVQFAGNGFANLLFHRNELARQILLFTQLFG